VTDIHEACIFVLVKGNEYRCCQFRELGKYRSVRVIKKKFVGRKNPENDHHEPCYPVTEANVMALTVNREIWHDVRSHGQRPMACWSILPKKSKHQKNRLLLCLICHWCGFVLPMPLTHWIYQRHWRSCSNSLLWFTAANTSFATGHSKWHQTRPTRCMSHGFTHRTSKSTSNL